MPGYFVHLAACTPQARESISFVRGVEAPDLLKMHFKIYGHFGARKKYESLKTSDMPNYFELENRAWQKESTNSTDGTHFGVSSNPGILVFWNDLPQTQKLNPFYRGYLWHLITDAIVYSRLDLVAKLQKVFEANKNNPDLENIKEAELQNLHSDWDMTNSRIKETYPDVTLTPEILELNVVKFTEGDSLHYVDWDILKETIDFLRSFDPLNGDIESIMQTVMKNI